MTTQEFQSRYHGFMTEDRAAAHQEAEKVNKHGIEGDTAIPVLFGTAWCLMLKSSIDFLSESDLGIL